MNKISSIIETIKNEFLKASLISFLNSVVIAFGFPSKLDIYTLKNGVRIKFSPETLDLMVIRECLVNNLYIKFINDKSLTTVLDLGCQKGYFVTGLLSSGINIKKAVCVDPFLENIEIFKENMKLNKKIYKTGKKILLEPSAVFTKNGKKEFYITRNSVNHSLKNPSKYDKVINKLVVNTITIRSLFKKYKLNELDLVKIDIEGSEFDLFRSGDVGKLLKTKYLVIEVHPDKKNHADEIIGVLKFYGFNIKYPNAAYKNLMFASKEIS